MAYGVGTDYRHGERMDPPESREEGELSDDLDDEDLEYFDDEEEDDDEDLDYCDGCGKPLGDGCCPMCCGHDYAPGSEECEFCDHEKECAKEDRDACSQD